MDLALLKIDDEDLYKLDLGDSDDVKIGEKAIAIGNPLGLAFTATEGIISARDRKGANNLPIYFQIDVPLNPGNSGGPLINTKGEVIGINNFKVSGAEGLGFALEINPAIEAINQISLQALNKTII
jgi:S1-C subfamily serine protease